jgi:hypothetical protein
MFKLVFDTEPVHSEQGLERSGGIDSCSTVGDQKVYLKIFKMGGANL